MEKCFLNCVEIKMIFFNLVILESERLKKSKSKTDAKKRRHTDIVRSKDKEDAGLSTVESFIFVGFKFRGFQISDKLVGI